jgi:hypothetical protein
MMSSQQIRARVNAGNITIWFKIPVSEAPHKGSGCGLTLTAYSVLFFFIFL